MNMFLRMIVCVSCATLLGVTLRLMKCPDLITGMAMYFISTTVNDILIEYERQRQEFLNTRSNPDTIDDWESRSNDSD